MLIWSYTALDKHIPYTRYKESEQLSNLVAVVVQGRFKDKVVR